MQEIEIEYKNLLTPSEFHTLLSVLPFPETPQTQINYYFETVDFQLKQRHSALRIRKKNDAFQLTLKEPYEEGILETHDTLSQAEANEWINGSRTRKAHVNVGKRLTEIGINIEQLKYFGELTTKRRQYEKSGFIFVLDHSHYQQISDYELEIEAPDPLSGKQTMDRLLSKYQITKKETPNKIARYFAALEKNKR